MDGKNLSDDKPKGYRYAVLNLAVLQFIFGNKNEAKVALEESIMMAHEANDNVCLQHALAWMYVIKGKREYKLIERSILKSLELNLVYVMSFGIQSFVQLAGLTSGNPRHIFEVNLFI